ncbi:glycosyl hydrolase family 10 protein [Arabidopsis lyrata subsp. lyrata]|uniref:Glycosyl hydrolase family 10 protein n=2 Tax=Arabidopsis lyrata subsp. lyrata TaxID=81972 RepID=D7MFM0_ARALL|nr:glycosyl hydrolase family 10 protein [Arabidopsis lyrata subsp. lyrata]
MKYSYMYCLIFLALSLLTAFTPASSSNGLDGPFYDSTAYTECRAEAEKPLYNGGMLKDQKPSVSGRDSLTGIGARYTPTYILHNLTQNTIYCFSIWVKIEAGAASARVRARLRADNATLNCVGSVTAKHGCWSFLKGGFLLDSPCNQSILFFETSNDDSKIQLQVASASLQPFTQEQWRNIQDYFINTARKRAVTIHVSEENGESVEGAEVTVEQISKDFPIGSAISKTILGNIPYQEWFVKRFDATVFENELKWYATEPDQGKLNYTLADKMMNFVRANRIIARGHNIFWEDPKYNPNWVRNLSGEDLRSAVNRRIKSLMTRYRGEFVHWDVSNEMLHFDFYESRLGKNASYGFFAAAREIDSLATLFFNDFNVVETCSDEKSTVDEYIARVRELQRYDGIRMDGIGLEGHFTTPNVALMRAIIDKLATLQLPIWLTEIDISSSLDHRTQAIYLEQVLREGFSHPSVNGIMLWTALHPNGCYQMCLTDDKFRNLPAGDMVDQKLLEWKTREVKATTDDHGSFSFFGFLGEYRVGIVYQGKTVNSSFSLSQGPETKHVRLQI